MTQRPPGKRAPNRAGTFYLGADGDWHGRITLGVRDDGRPDRRHVRGKSEHEVRTKVREIEDALKRGHLHQPGRRWTVAQWLTHWVDNIAAPSVRPSTLSAYRVAVRKHLIPGVGAHRLDRLEPEHLEKLYVRMLESGLAPATAHQVHRTVRTALNQAVHRGHLPRNPAQLAKAPRLPEWDVEPLTLDEVRQLLDTAARSRNGARWAVALALGLRQGEALGLRWADLDLDAGRMVIRRSRQRPEWIHGCDGTCGRNAGACPERQNRRGVVSDTKSRAGRRVIGLPRELAALLREHRAAQDQERITACQLWHESDWVFTTQTGEPINLATDYHHWKKLLRDAGVREVRLHDARHTAATVLLLLGVPDRAVMSLMGWSNTAMAARYQHLTAAIHADIAERLGGVIWTSTETRTETGGTDEQPAEDG